MAERYPHKVRGAVFALIGGILWGFSANCSEVLMGSYGIDVGWLAAVRMAAAAAFFIGVSLVTSRKKLCSVLRDKRSLTTIVFFAVCGILLTQISYLNAIHAAGSGPALLLEQLGLALTMLYLCWRSHRLPYKRELIGLVLAFIGVVLIATQGDPTTLNMPMAGLMWGLVSAVSLAIYNVTPVRPLASYGSMVVIGLAMAIGDIPAMVLFQPWTTSVQLDAMGWVLMVAVVLVGTILAYLFFVQGIKDTGPMRAGLIGSIEPVSAMVISAVWLGTTVSLYDCLGAVAIVAMIFLVTQREDKPSEATVGGSQFSNGEPYEPESSDSMNAYKDRLSNEPEELTRA